MQNINIETQIKEGIRLLQEGNPEQAEELFRDLSVVDPNNTDVMLLLGVLLYKKGDFENAIPYFQQVLFWEPSSAGAYNNLGLALQETGKLDDAIENFRKAVHYASSVAPFHANLGNAFAEKRLYRDAITNFQNALNLDPGYTEASDQLSKMQFNLGNELLYVDDFEHGWPLLIGSYDTLRKPLPQPLWTEFNIQRLSMLVYSEWGFGDTIQFARYIPPVANRGAKVILLCEKPLASLLKNVRGVHAVVIDDAGIVYDVQSPLLRLPLVFGTKVEDIPVTTPYLSAPVEIKTVWNAKVSNDTSKLKIGLVWSGDPLTKWDNIRSIPLEEFRAFS